MSKELTHEERLIQRLDNIAELLQDLLIVEGVKAGVRNQDLRKLLRISMSRVTRASKVYAKAKRLQTP